MNNPQVHRFFQDTTQKYGQEGIFGIRLLNLRCAILTSPELVQAVTSRQADLPKAPEM